MKRPELQSLALTTLLALGLQPLPAAAGGGAPARGKPAPPRSRPAVKPAGKPGVKRAPTKVVLPPNAAPAISLTAQRPDIRSAELQLAKFIKALQKNERQKAVLFLSRRVTPAERQALVRKQWLRRDPKNRKDFAQVLFQPDLQIRTREIRPETLRLYVEPRGQKREKNRPLAAYLEVRMRREEGRWMVELHPERGVG